jgi:flavin-binding protein dodecin
MPVFAVLRAQQQDWQSSPEQQREWVIARAYRDETENAILEAIQLARADQTLAELEYIKDCPIDTIRKIQHEQLDRQRMTIDNQKTIVHQLLMKPARKLSRSWSLRTFLHPQFKKTCIAVALRCGHRSEGILSFCHVSLPPKG